MRSVPERCSVCLRNFQKGETVIVNKKAVVQRGPIYRDDGTLMVSPFVYYDTGKISEAMHEDCPVVC